MIIRKLFLDGYGRFMGREIQFTDGLQVVLGANEQGKTTMRNFITDMLYGQKASSTQRRYEESHLLRRPWDDNGVYAGRMTYCLDNGQEFEVHRTFDRKSESVQVFNHTHGREITGEFPMGRNREIEFAAHHLGLSKVIFANLAVIGHASLESLGDADALLQIGEKIASLADTADEASSSAAAVKHLDAYVARIGRLVPNSKRPLPLAKARVEQLDAELSEARRARDDVAGLDGRLRTARNQVQALRTKQANLERQIRKLEQTERHNRLHKAETVQGHIESLTQRLFSLAKAKDFPLEQEDVFHAALNAVETAREQVARTEARVEELLRRYREASRNLENDAVEIQDIPEQFENPLKELDTQVARLRDFTEDLEKAQQTARDEIAHAEQELEALPDFETFDADPMACINQHANSFSLAQQERDRARELLNRLEAERERRETELALPKEVFSRFDDFPAQARDYAVETKLSEERCAQHRKRIEEAQRDLEGHEQDLPNFRVMAIFGALLAVILLVFASVTGNKGIYLVEVFALGVFAYNTAHWLHARLNLRQLRGIIDGAEAEIARLEEEKASRETDMNDIVHQAECGSFRELEAMYERFVKERNELGTLLADLEHHQHQARVEESHVAQKLERLHEIFSALGETIQSEEDVSPAAAQAIVKYQRYCETKRRREEQQRQLDSLAVEARRSAEKLAAKEEQEKRLSLEVRKLLRNAGYKEEANHTSALGALRAYGIRIAQLRPRRANAEALKQQADEFAQQLEQDRRELEQAQEDLSQLLDNVGVDSVEEYRALAAQAREYREARIKRASLGEQLDTLLGNDTFESLRDAVQDGDSEEQLLLEDGPALRAAFEYGQKELEARGKEIHSLELAIAERCAGLRSINEIEEERASVAQRVEDLQLELDAAAHAAAIIEEVAHDRHARVAPSLARTASRYLHHITDGAYSQLVLNKNLQVTVRIPQTEKLNTSPEKHLSKGTVDQIYLALRLALVTNLCEEGESVPMLLDDPFANYDDVRLERALTLLKELNAVPQILLFTCREDVAETAHTLGVPVLAL
ncbi:MAG TPA: AAA family ATPase [Candidatus Hydrogenedentes bacterium]|nr:AAA family ATPase [Candidatus Hydrogenedentota bacterium]